METILPFRRRARRIRIPLGVPRRRHLGIHPRRTADACTTTALRIAHPVCRRSRRRRVDRTPGWVVPCNCRCQTASGDREYPGRRSRNPRRHPRIRHRSHPVGCTGIPRHLRHPPAGDPPGRRCRGTTAPRPAWPTAIREEILLRDEMGGELRR